MDMRNVLRGPAPIFAGGSVGTFFESVARNGGERMEPFVNQPFSEATQPTSRSGLARKGMLLVAALVMMGLAIGVGLRDVSAAPSPWTSLPQSVAPQVSAAAVTGSLPGSQRMTIAITLQSRNETALKAYASQVGVPHSRVYHQYLTPALFALNFGPDTATLNAVEHYYQTQGLHLDSAVSGGLFLQFSGTVSQVESALRTHINTYRAPDGRAFYANVSSLQLPASFASKVIDVTGTETARVSHAAGAVANKNKAAQTVQKASVVHPNVTVTCPTVPAFSGAAAPYTAAGLLPTQLNNTYNFANSTNPGSGQWAAFVEMDGYSLADLAQYANCVGISSAIQTAITASSAGSTPFIITQNVSSGTGTVLSNTGVNYGTALTPGANAVNVEEELEVFLGLVPNLSHITVMETANSSMGILNALSAIANENAAQVVGYQWGQCEADAGYNQAASEQQFFMQMALQGQSTFAATGNNGLYACNGDGNNFRQFGFAAQDPATDPYVTAVGGSELGLSTNVAATAKWAAEQPWNNSPTTNQAGGSGISQFWAAPSWQQSSKAALTSANSALAAYQGVETLYNPNTNLTTNLPARVIPDVSAAADPSNSSVAIYCSVGSGCTSGATTFSNAGGTAEAEAIWAAAGIEGNQTSGAPAAGAGGRLGLISPALYTLYGQDTAGSTTYTLNATNFCDYGSQLGVSTTSTTAVTGAGSTIITPAAMTDIIVGSLLTIDAGPSLETVTVTAITGTTFTATFTKTHLAGFTIVGAVNTTTASNISPGSQTVTPLGGTAMEDILVGETLNIAVGATPTENVVVTAITATTFTAIFQYTHAGGTVITLVAIGTQNTAAITVGVNVVTPVTGTLMQNILVNESVHIAAGGGIAEDVTVTAVTATTFTAAFGSTHTAGTAITLTAIATEATGAIIVGSNTVTPTTGTVMQDIYLGESVHLVACGGTAEDVAVTAVTATTFTATFGFTHTALCAITAVAATTTNTAAVTVAGTQTVTPVSMTGIVIGQVMQVGGETITVTAITPTTFTATGFTLGHPIGAAVITNVLINTNSGASTVTGTFPAVVTVTPANMTGIYTGQSLKVDAGGSLETITVTATTGTTFTASFTLAHTGTWIIVGHSNSGTAFNQTCTTALNFALNNSLPFNGGVTTVTSSFPQNATYNYQQLPGLVTAIYGSQAGFAVKGGYTGPVYDSGYNALMGLGSPNVGNTTTGSGQLLSYWPTRTARASRASTWWRRA